MPSVKTRSNCSGMPNAIEARIASFVGGVDALDVERRVGLGVAEPLRLGEHVVEAAPLVGHRAEG